MSNVKIRIIAKEIELIKDKDGNIISTFSKHVTKDFPDDFVFGNPFKNDDFKKSEIISAEILED